MARLQADWPKMHNRQYLILLALGSTLTYTVSSSVPGLVPPEGRLVCLLLLCSAFSRRFRQARAGPCPSHGTDHVEPVRPPNPYFPGSTFSVHLLLRITALFCFFPSDYIAVQISWEWDGEQSPHIWSNKTPGYPLLILEHIVH